MSAVTTSIIVPHVSAELRAALVADAESRDVSINEAAVGPLALAYGVPRLPSSIGFSPVGEQETMTLRIPRPLRKKLRARAAREDVTIAGLVRACLAEHYGLPVESARRRPRS